jgi:hypothetical protein
MVHVKYKKWLRIIKNKTIKIKKKREREREEGVRKRGSSPLNPKVNQVTFLCGLESEVLYLI